MNDRITLHELQVAAKVGVPDLERVAPQRLVLQVVLHGDFRGCSDDLARTVDYAAVAGWLRAECARVEFRLLESLADHLAAGLLSNFAPVAAVDLEIRKFILPEAGHVAVAVRRVRD